MPPPPKFSTHLSTTSPLLLDGALATYLESLGADISSSLWSASILTTHPDLIQRTHLDYFRSGAQVAITASYQASIPGLIVGLGITESEAKDSVKKSVHLAQAARYEYLDSAPHSAGPLFIAGSVGPYGAFLADGSEYTGAYSLPKEEMKDFHRGRIAALVEAGVDVLACETMPTKSEVEALIELLETEFDGVEAWFTFTLRDGERIADGTPLVEIAALFEHVPQVIGLGFNCVPDDIALAALKTLKPLTEKTLIVYPNSGESWNAGKREWEGSKAEGETLAHKTREWYSAGARMIGGCCRTGAEDIAVMKDALKSVGSTVGAQE